MESIHEEDIATGSGTTFVDPENSGGIEVFQTENTCNGFEDLQIENGFELKALQTENTCRFEHFQIENATGNCTSMYGNIEDDVGIAIKVDVHHRENNLDHNTMAEALNEGNNLHNDTMAEVHI